jgi:hypothetical protein
MRITLVILQKRPNKEGNQSTTKKTGLMIRNIFYTRAVGL